MTVFQHVDVWKRVAAKAYGSGAEVLNPGGEGHGLTRLHWNVAGRCQRPVYREYVGSAASPIPGRRYDHIKRGRQTYSRGPAHIVELSVRCRVCPACLRARAALWRLRAQAEIEAAGGRTWFGTLTLRPEEHFKIVSQIRSRMAKSGSDFDTLSEADQFGERVRQIGKEITLWLKRVRKESGAGLRYCLVAEAHKSGLPHFHILVHEVRPDGPVGERTLRRQWPHGFSNFKLVAQHEKAVAGYVAKYLAKSAVARVRASQGYGQSAGFHGLDHRQKPF